MRIARVVTICAALITTFFVVETTRSKRRPVLKGQSPQQGRENGTNASEITFTTVRPEVSSLSHNARSSVYQVKRLARVRPGRSMSYRSRGSSADPLNGGSRRRRQLQHLGSKSGHVARSFEYGDNRVESQHVEMLQPPDAFGKGVIHIEPIYRVTKSKNIFDSIIDIVRRIIDPPKSVGSLVGPFHFPGVGDKVYVRLLEQDRPDHVVIRLISHLPPDEVDTSFHRNAAYAGEHVLSQPEISSVHQTTIALPKEVLHDSHGKHEDVNVASSDNYLSASNGVGQISKGATVQVQQNERTNDYPKREHIFTTYESNLKPVDGKDSHGVVRHRKRNPMLGPMMQNNNNNNNNNIVSPYANRTQDRERYEDSFERNQVYHFQSPINDSSKENYASFHVNYQAVRYPRNISTHEETFYGHPINPFDAFSRSSIPSAVDRSKNSSEDTDGPRYSIQFASKRMRYLNLDGSVEPAIKEETPGSFVNAPLGFADRQWKPIIGIADKDGGMGESVMDNEDGRILQERSDNNSGEELIEIEWRSIEDLTSSRNVTTSRNATTAGKQRSSRCCLEHEDEKRNGNLSSGESSMNGTIVSNSTNGTNSTDSQVQLQRLSTGLGNSTNPTKV